MTLESNRRRTQKYLEKIQRNVEYAFEFGEPIVIRTLVREVDSDAIQCPRCWDNVRVQAGDTYCPACYGNGFVSHETLTGYRLRVFSKAHIEDIGDQVSPRTLGDNFYIEAVFWINHTERELRAGDLILRFEPEDNENPQFGSPVIHDWQSNQLFEVKNAIQPSLRPSSQKLNSESILAQKVTCVLVDVEQRESLVDMNENLKYWMLDLGAIPEDNNYDDNWAFINE